MFNEQFTTEQYQDELDHYPYYDSYASNPTDKVRWARLGFLFLTCFVSYIVGSVPVNPPLILFTCAGAMLGALLILRAWEMEED